MLQTFNKVLTLGTNSIFNNFKWNAFGVDLYANILDDNGMGCIARSLYTALQTNKIPVNVTQFTSLLKHKVPNHYPINIILGGGESSMLTTLYNNIPEDEYTIGVWFWELEDYFPWIESYNYVDEVWCFSQFCKDIFEKNKTHDIPIIKITYGPELNIPISLNKYHFDKFTFLYTFDYFGSIERKNPYGVVDAFVKAFGNSSDVQLVIKSMSGGGFAHDQAIFKHYIKRYNNIIYIDEVISKSDFISLIKASNCYVSLHRSEGLGIGMMEAMYLGTPVIATAYGGSMEFSDPHCMMLVYYDKKPTFTDLCYYNPSSLWADPDIDDAAFCMHYMYYNKDATKYFSENAKRYIDANFNQQLLNSQIMERINAIHRIIY